MQSCYARVQGLPSEELERLAAGQGSDDACEQQAAMQVLAYRQADARWRESIGSPDTTERLLRFRSRVTAAERIDEGEGP